MQEMREYYFECIILNLWQCKNLTHIQFLLVFFSFENDFQVSKLTFMTFLII